MATRKKTSTKKTSTKKAPAKKVAKKAAKKALDETRKIKAVAGQESHFYKGFPRGLAYALLLKAPKRTMVVANFISKIEKLDGVKSRKQARGIVSKMIDKPGDDGQKNGQIAHYVS